MKLIPLTQGKFAQVDDEDYEYLSQFKWYPSKDANTYYAIRNGRIGEKRTIGMHKEILKPKEGKICDHIDRNGLNNQKSNLREGTRLENCRNQSKYAKCTSKFKGVHYHKGVKKWRAKITVNKKTIHIGYFDLEIEAAKAYDVKAKEYFGEFANLNFKIV